MTPGGIRNDYVTNRTAKAVTYVVVLLGSSLLVAAATVNDREHASIETSLRVEVGRSLKVDIESATQRAVQSEQLANVKQTLDELKEGQKRMTEILDELRFGNRIP